MTTYINPISFNTFYTLSSNCEGFVNLKNSCSGKIFKVSDIFLRMVIVSFLVNTFVLFIIAL